MKLSAREIIQKRGTLLIGIAVILVILIALGYRHAIRDGRVGITRLETGDELVRPPSGEIVTGFPSELIVEPDVFIAESYAINYAGGDIRQPVASYVSEKSLGENIGLFRDYFNNSGWTLVHEADASEPVPFFYATRGDAHVNVTLIPTQAGVSVNIAHATIR